jgi:hypothetical protein
MKVKELLMFLNQIVPEFDDIEILALHCENNVRKKYKSITDLKINKNKDGQLYLLISTINQKKEGKKLCLMK